MKEREKERGETHTHTDTHTHTNSQTDTIKGRERGWVCFIQLYDTQVHLNEQE